MEGAALFIARVGHQETSWQNLGMGLQPAFQTVAASSPLAISEGLKVALIAATVSTLVFASGELVKFLYRRADRRESSRAVYRKYADPITAVAGGLLWRLKEIFDGSGAGYYLTVSDHAASFEHYKAISTLYRLAALLGWIRALRRELFFLSGHDPGRLAALEAGLAKVQSLLADGNHMEVSRVNSIVDLLYPGTSLDLRTAQEVGTELDYRLDRKLHVLQANSCAELSDDDAKSVVAMAVEIVSSGLGLPRATQAQLDDHWRAGLEFLAVREAWIYRDWQAALGDLMLRESPAGDRKYEVIGFREFEEMCVSGAEEQKKWLRRLNAVLDELDVGAPPATDARIAQVRSLYSACGQVLAAIHDVDPNASNVDGPTLKVARAAMSNAT